MAQISNNETLSKSYQAKAEGFLHLPQFNLDSSYPYFKKAISILKTNESAHYQALSEANFKLYTQLYTFNISPDIDSCLKISRYYIDKIPQKNAKAKLIEYNILIQ